MADFLLHVLDQLSAGYGFGRCNSDFTYNGQSASREAGKQPSAVFEFPSYDVRSIRFSPDAKRLACTDGFFLGVWDMETCSSLFHVHTQ